MNRLCVSVNMALFSPDYSFSYSKWKNLHHRHMTKVTRKLMHLSLNVSSSTINNGLNQFFSHFFSIVNLCDFYLGKHCIAYLYFDLKQICFSFLVVFWLSATVITYDFVWRQSVYVHFHKLRNE